MSLFHNNALIGSSGQKAGDDYVVKKSCRFDDNATSYLQRSNPAKKDGNRRTWTWAGWVKFADIQNNKQQMIFDTWVDTNDYALFDCDDKLRFKGVNGGYIKAELNCNREMRDCGGFYHLVLAVDTTNSIEKERVKIFVNGKRETSFSTETYPPQNQSLQVGWRDYNATLGKRISSYFDGYMADVYFIDGIQLSPGAFIKYDESGCIQPKEFSIPAPNDGTNHSNTVTATNFHTDYGHTRIFDGNTGTQAMNFGAGATASSWFSVEWPTPVEFNTSLRLFVHMDGRSAAGNPGLKVTTDKGVLHFTGEGVAGAGNETQEWLTIVEGKGSFTKLEGQVGTHTDYSMSFRAVEVDGKILIDGTTDETVRTNIYPKHNDRTIWIENSDFTFSGNGYGSNAPTKAVDGNLTTYMNNNAGGQTITWDCEDAFSGFSNKKLRLYCAGSDYDIYVNGTDTGENGPSSAGWVDLGTFSSITEIKFDTSAGSAGFYLYGVEVDDCLLINNAGDHSFHFKFDNTATDTALGHDTLSDINNPNKGGPILTTKDGGHKLDSGTNTDSNASSLVLAIPCNSATDVHHTVKGSGSAKTITYTAGATAKTDISRYYGTSTYCDGSGARIVCSQTNDCTFAGECTAEGWFYLTDNINNSVLIWSGGASTDSTGQGRYLVWCDSNKATFVAYDGSNGSTPTQRIQGSTTITADEWHHIAFTRNSSDLVTLYLDGQSQGTWNSTNFWTGQNNHSLGGQNNSGAPQIGSQDGGNNSTGYFQDFRFYSTCKYTSEFVPQAPNDFSVYNLNANDGGKTVNASDVSGGKPIRETTESPNYGQTAHSSNLNSDSNASNLVLAIPFNKSTPEDVSHTIRGSGSAKDLTITGSNNVKQASGARYYGGCFDFNASSANTDYIEADDTSSDFTFGTGNFTIECWYNYDGTNDSQSTNIFFGQPDPSSNAGNFIVYNSGSGAFFFRWGGNPNYASIGAGYDSWPAFSSRITSDKWHHIAIVRKGTGTDEVAAYVDGVSVGTCTIAANLTGNEFSLGYWSGNSYINKGKMQDYRIYKGVSKYTSNFTVPAAPAPEEIDSLCDTPSNSGEDTGLGGEVTGNYCTLNALNKHSDCTLSEGNLTIKNAASNANRVGSSTFGMSSGKWYWEVESLDTSTWKQMGVHVDGKLVDSDNYFESNGWALQANGAAYGASGATQPSFGNTVKGDIYGVALDVDAGKIWFSKNGTYPNSGNPATGANPVWSGVTPTSGNSASGKGTALVPGYSVKDNDTGWRFNFGARAFKYQAPSGFKALCTQNLSDTFSGDNINNCGKFFDVVRWEDNSKRIYLPQGFAPDLVWHKERNGDRSHGVYDRIRGTGNSSALLDTANANAAAAEPQGVTAFESDGFTVGTHSSVDDLQVGWAWDAGTSANTTDLDDGTIDISSGNQWVNSEAGFSMTKYEGNNTNNATLSHGLTVPPELIIIKCISSSADGTAGSHWLMKHVGLSMTNTSSNSHMYMNLTLAQSANDHGTVITHASDNTLVQFVEGSGSPTLHHVNGVHGSGGHEYMMYCWASKSGYSKFGSYSGGDDFIHTGFRPHWILVKSYSHTGAWPIWNSESDKHNPAYRVLWAHLYGAESSDDSNVYIDILSNGFYLRNSDTDSNGSGRSYVYCAFADHPMKTSRAR